jgi:hypothetical protein
LSKGGKKRKTEQTHKSCKQYSINKHRCPTNALLTKALSWTRVILHKRKMADNISAVSH